MKKKGEKDLKLKREEIWVYGKMREKRLSEIMRKRARSLRGKDEDKSAATALGGDGNSEWWWSSQSNQPWRLAAS